MKKLFKRVPRKGYEASYDLNDDIIRQIVKDTTQPWEKNAPMTEAGVSLALEEGRTIKVTSRFGDDILWSLEDDIPVADLDLTEACQMMAGIRPKRMQDDEAFLLSGTGEMWEVRVCSDTDPNDYEEFEVRAESPLEAATKAETVARRNPDLYFDRPIYTADHSTIQKIADLYEEEIVYDREGPR
jgi:hypothetical protein